MNKFFVNKVTVFTAIVCFGLVAALVAHTILGSYSSDQRSTRTVDVSVDHAALLRNFDSYGLNKTDEIVTLEAVRSIPLDLFSELEQLSFSEIEERGPKVLYDIRYDLEEGLIYLTMKLVDFEDEVVEIDTFVGATFFNERGQLDAVFNVDDKPVLMSQMANVGVVENLFFKEIFKAIVVVVAVVAVVVAVAAVVVSTAGIGAVAVAGAGVTVGGSVATGTSFAGIAVAATVVAAVAIGVYLIADSKPLSLEKISEAEKEIDNNPHKRYLPAFRDPNTGGLRFITVPVDITEASPRIRTGQDFWTSNSFHARDLAVSASGGVHNGAPEINRVRVNGTSVPKDGCYWHYHLLNKLGGSHSFFGTPHNGVYL